MRGNYDLLAFNRGEVSKTALTRVDIEKLRLAADCQINWEPSVVGAASLRAGLQHVGQTRGDARAALFPFVFSKHDTALLELTGGILRVWVNDELVTRTAVSTVISDGLFAGGGAWSTSDTTAGCTATIGSGLLKLSASARGGLARAKQTLSISAPDQPREHGLRLVVERGPVILRVGTADGLSDLIAQTELDTGIHALAFTPNAANAYIQIETITAPEKRVSAVTIDDAGTLEIDTPWGEGVLGEIRRTQSGDIVFTACRGQQQYKIERRGLTAWSVVVYRSDNGPFQIGPGLLANFTPSAHEGNGTLTSDRPYFTAEHVGASFQLFCKGQTNRTVLGAQNAFSDPVRVSGVGTVARNFSFTISGTWAGTITHQRSFDGPDSGFTDVASVTSNGTIASSTGGSAGSPNLDNVIAWERVGFKSGNYTSGAATVQSNYTSGGAYGICRVTGFISATQVEVEMLRPMSSLSPTEAWSESDWSDNVGWPSTLALYEGRLWMFGRDKIWGSQSNFYTGFGQIDLSTGEEIGDSGAIVQTFGEGAIDVVNWALPLSRLLAGREQSVASIRSSSFDEPLTPTNFAVKDCATQGTARLPALKVDKRGIFVQESGRRVYALDFNASAMDYSIHDLTRLNRDIGAAGFVDVAIARQPDTAAYMVRGDGTCAVLLFDPDDEVEAWWRIMTLGVIENVCVLPASSGSEDHVYFVVRRRIDGVERRFIEKLASRENCKGGQLNQALDCHVVREGNQITSITAAHLPNTRVRVWVDGVDQGEVITNVAGVATLPSGVAGDVIVAGLTGAVETYSGDPVAKMTGLSAYEGLTAEVFADQQPSDRLVRVGARTVVNGEIALPDNWTASSIVAFFGYVAPFMSAKLAYGARIGSPVSQRKKLDHVGLVLYETHAMGLKVGQRFDVMDDMPLIEAGGEVDAATIWGEYDQPTFEVPGEWDTDARFCMLAQAPLPATVGGLVIALDTNDK